MSEQQRQPTEQELKAYAEQLEEQMRKLRVEDVIVQTIVTLVNLGGRKAGLAAGTEQERDLDQLRLAIDGARALLPLMESELGPDAAAIRDALSQLQMAYAQQAGGAAASGGAQAPKGDEPPKPGPAQASGRLWVPGQ